MGCLKLPYETERQGLKNYAFLAGERLGNFGFKPKKYTNAYEYFLRDHLGNNRVVFTTKPKTHGFTLNYESDTNLPDDEGLFEELNNIVPANIHDHTDAGSTYDKSQLLNGANGGVIGSVLTIPVGAGDKVSAEVYAKYLTATGTSNPTAAVGSLLIAALTGNTGINNYEGSITSSYGTSGSMVTNMYGDDLSDTEPKAFINLMFLSDDITETPVIAFNQIESASNNTHAKLTLPEEFVAPSAGYIVVYLSNESTSLTEVYFDDLKVTVNEHPVIQKADYYPFGLTFNSYQRVTAKENKYLYNGKEKQTDLDLGWLDYGARMYQPEIGRWNHLDPLAEKYYDYSPYVYALNNPINLIDPDGREVTDPEKIKKAAKNSVQNVKDTYDTDGTQSAQCNRGVNYAFNEVTGSDELNGKTANEIVNYMANSENFTKVELSEVQELANNGEVVIGGKAEDGGSGHVVLAVPGKEESSGKWKGKVPQVMDTGEGKRSEKNGVNYSWAKGDGVGFYKYTGSGTSASNGTIGSTIEKSGKAVTNIMNGAAKVIRKVDNQKNSFINHFKSLGRQFIPR